MTKAPPGPPSATLFEGLVRFDANLKIEAALAQSWSNPDATHWLFQIRPGVRFHDGRPLEAGDVAYSIRRAATFERSVISPYFTSIRQVTALDARRVEIETREPDPLLLNKLTFVYIVPRAASLENPALANKPVGTGPYRFDHWLTENRFLLKRFDGYWGRQGSSRRSWFPTSMSRANGWRPCWRARWI